MTIAIRGAGENALAPEAEKEIGLLAMGDRKYQCCIHPWMRGLIKVSAGASGR